MKRKYFLILSLIILTSGCYIYYPKDEALLKARKYEEKGFRQTAHRMREEARELSGWHIGFGDEPWESRSAFIFPEENTSSHNFSVNISTTARQNIRILRIFFRDKLHLY